MAEVGRGDRKRATLLLADLEVDALRRLGEACLEVANRKKLVHLRSVFISEDDLRTIDVLWARMDPVRKLMEQAKGNPGMAGYMAYFRGLFEEAKILMRMGR